MKKSVLAVFAASLFLSGCIDLRPLFEYLAKLNFKFSEIPATLQCDRKFDTVSTFYFENTPFWDSSWDAELPDDTGVKAIISMYNDSACTVETPKSQVSRNGRFNKGDIQFDTVEKRLEIKHRNLVANSKVGPKTVYLKLRIYEASGQEALVKSECRAIHLTH